LALGIDSNGAGALELFDQIVYVEVLDDNNKPVPVGKPGKVVITVLGNNIQPLIRYSLDDQLSLLNESPASPWTLAEAVSGRTLDKIHFKLKNKEVIIHPMDLVGLFIPGLKQYQIEQTGEASATFRLVAENQEQVQKYIDAALPEFLSEVGLAPGDVDLKIEFVEKIAPNPKTGKTPIVIALKTVV
jgi:phenylacetate-coenzyme A ligase PaaK-like adenylate-forming protein